MKVISKYGGVTSCTADSYVCPVDIDDGVEEKSGIEEQRKGWGGELCQREKCGEILVWSRLLCVAMLVCVEQIEQKIFSGRTILAYFFVV